MSPADVLFCQLKQRVGVCRLRDLQAAWKDARHWCSSPLRWHGWLTVFLWQGETHTRLCVCARVCAVLSNPHGISIIQHEVCIFTCARCWLQKVCADASRCCERKGWNGKTQINKNICICCVATRQRHPSCCRAFVRYSRTMMANLALLPAANPLEAPGPSSRSRAFCFNRLVALFFPPCSGLSVKNNDVGRSFFQPKYTGNFPQHR